MTDLAFPTPPGVPPTTGASDASRVRAWRRLTPEWMVAPAAEQFGPEWPAVAARATAFDAEDGPDAGAYVGLTGLRGLGTVEAGTTLPPTGDNSAAGPVLPGRYWQGVAALGDFGTVPDYDKWPTTGFVYEFDGMFLPHGYFAASEWNETLLCTIDEQVDYFEPSFTNQRDGVRWGFDFLVDGDPVERTILLQGVIPDVCRRRRYRWEVDQAEWRFYVDGALFESGTTYRANAGDPIALDADGPWQFQRPPDGHLVTTSRRSVVEFSNKLTNQDGEVVIHFHPDADATHGATEVVSSGQTWTTVGGICLEAPTGPRLLHVSAGHEVPGEVLDFTDTESVTLAWRFEAGGTFDFGEGARAGRWQHRDIFGVLSTGAPGFGVVRFDPMGLDYGVLAGDGDGHTLLLDTGATPPLREHTLALVIDRDADEARLYLNGTRKATAPLDGFGGIVSETPAVIGSGYGTTAMAAMWRRALTGTEVGRL